MIEDVFGDRANERRWAAHKAKVPYSPVTGRLASSTDLSTWGTLEEARYLCDEQGLDGVGIFLNSDGLGVAELDACRDPETGGIADWAREVVLDFASATEVSVSGTGLHTYVDGAPAELPSCKIPMPGPVIGKKSPAVECYVTARFLVVTGDFLDIVPDEIVNRGEAGGAWDRMVRRLGAGVSGNGKKHTGAAAVTGNTEISEELRRALGYDGRLRILWTEGTEGGADRSRNDAALAACLGGRGFAPEAIEAALRAYKLGQIGQGVLTGRAADRQVGRLLAIAAEGRVDPIDATTAEPLFRAADIRFARFLAAEPPARRMLLEDVLPLSVVALLAGMGGAGKSYLAYQLLFCVAAGIPWGGMRVLEPGGVLGLFSEDDEGELHRRAWSLLRYYGVGAETREAVAERLHIMSRVAANNLLTTAAGDGEVRRTPLVERLIEAASQIPDLRLIVLDPVSRFRGGQPNHEEHATRYVEALEAIREATGATVLNLSHISKAGILNDGGQEIVRGSTALVDGVRWVATLQRLRRDDAPDYGIREEEADRYLRFDVPKNNYAPPFAGLWLRREAGGVLVPTTLETTRATKTAKRIEGRYLEIVGKVQDLIRAEGPMTSNRIETDFAGEMGPLGAGQKVVRDVLQRAVRDGDLGLQPNIGKGGGRILDLPGGAT